MPRYAMLIPDLRGFGLIEASLKRPVIRRLSKRQIDRIVAYNARIWGMNRQETLARLGLLP